jgi:hypothetical protein
VLTTGTGIARPGGGPGGSANDRRMPMAVSSEGEFLCAAVVTEYDVSMEGSISETC